MSIILCHGQFADSPSSCPCSLPDLRRQKLEKTLSFSSGCCPIFGSCWMSWRAVASRIQFSETPMWRCKALNVWRSCLSCLASCESFKLKSPIDSLFKLACLLLASFSKVKFTSQLQGISPVTWTYSEVLAVVDFKYQIPFTHRYPQKMDIESISGTFRIFAIAMYDNVWVCNKEK